MASFSRFLRDLLASDALVPCLAGSVGLFFGMANPLYHLPLLVLAYPACLMVLGVRAPAPGLAFKRGWLCGSLGSAACLYWIAVPITEVAGQPLIAGAASALLLGTYVGLFAGLFSLACFWMRGCAAWRLCLLWPLSWYLLEVLRGWLFTGFPWLALASAFAPWPSWIQGAAVIGAYGLGGLYAGLACLLAWSLRNRNRLGFGLALVALIGLPAFGSLRLTRSFEGGPPLRVTLAQGNIDQNQKWDQRYLDSTVAGYMDLSRDSDAALIVWPETAMPLDYPRHPLSSSLRRFAAGQNVWLLFGSPGFDQGPGQMDVFNRAWLLSPLGRDVGVYEKEHLVPFGEYVPPFLNLPFLEGLLQGIGDFTPGRHTAPLVLDAKEGRVAEPVALGLLICYETIFPELSRQRVAEGARVLVNISNDAWFGLSAAPYQHLHLSVLRAVEQARWLVRGTNTGISAFVDPCGRVVSRTGLFVRDALTDSVRPLDGRTLFYRFFPWLTPLAVILLLLLAPWPRRKPFARR